MQLMLDELETFPESVRFTRPEGGLFIWVELPESLDAVSLLPKAIERKVAYVPGTHFCVGGGHLNTLRLNFSNSTEDQIHSGMRALKEIIRGAL